MAPKNISTRVCSMKNISWDFFLIILIDEVAIKNNIMHNISPVIPSPLDNDKVLGEPKFFAFKKLK
jgi:hypothetical protein